eukprot:2371265-Prymnesium_polylepis.1
MPPPVACAAPRADDGEIDHVDAAQRLLRPERSSAEAGSSTLAAPSAATPSRASAPTAAAAAEAAHAAAAPTAATARAL